MNDYIFRAEDLSTEAWKIYEEHLLSISDEDFEINQVQMKKFADAVDFFIDQAIKSSGMIEPIKIEPRRQHCGLTAFFYALCLHGDDLKKFSDVVRSLSALSIDSGDGEMFCISITVPNIYHPKNK